MAVSFDWESRPEDEPWKRTYMPCSPVIDLENGDDEENDELSEAAQGTLDPQTSTLHRLSKVLLKSGPARGQAIVALRPIKDEELFQVRRH